MQAFSKNMLKTKLDQAEKHPTKQRMMSDIIFAMGRPPLCTSPGILAVVHNGLNGKKDANEKVGRQVQA